MKYTDLIPGNIYKGVVTGCKSKPIWIFQYTPPKMPKNDGNGNSVYHDGAAYEISCERLRKRIELWQFNTGWEFSEASAEEMKLLKLTLTYEIY